MNRLRLLACVGALLLTRCLAQTYTFSSTNFPGTTGGLALAPDGVVYVTTVYSHTIMKLSGGNGVLVAGRVYESGSKDGAALDARFQGPTGIAVDGKGALYIADSGNHTIRRITPDGRVTTLAGSAGQWGAADATGIDARGGPPPGSARFWSPTGVAVDAQGNVYVADTNNHAIRRITPGGIVTTFAGALATPGSADGTALAARFSAPHGLAIDAGGNLYVADSGNHAIRRITPAGVVTTVAGLGGSSGSLDGTGATARFSNPQGIAIDRQGTLFVADTGNQLIRKITTDGVVTTIAGLVGYTGGSSGAGATARFCDPRTIAIDSTGTLYVGDGYGLRVGVTSSDLAITVQPQPISVASGSTARFAVTATGDAPLNYQWRKDGTTIAGATRATYVIPAVQAGDSGSYGVTVTNAVGTVTSSNAVLTVLAALPNDNFANAATLSGATGSIPGNNNGATGEVGEPTHAVANATASSVWYTWTAPQSGTAVFEFVSSNHALAVYTGSILTTLSRVPATFSGSRVLFTATAGTKYAIAVGSYSDYSRGNFTLRWRMVLNDAFAQAQLLSGDSGQVTGSNDAATGEPGEPSHVPGTSATTTSVWYRWTAPTTATVIFDTVASSPTSPSIPAVLALYTGDKVDALTPVAAASSSSSVTRLVATVTAGTTYSLAVGSYGWQSGAFTLNWQTTTLPVITQQPQSAGVVGGAMVTFSIRVSSATPLTYQWYKDGNALAGGTNASWAIVTAGAADIGRYSVVVSNATGTVTSDAANLAVLVAPPNDNFASAQPVYGTTGTATGTNTNATSEPGEPVHWNMNGTASSVWYVWTPPSSGLAVVDTVGSSFDTVLAIYRGADFGSLTRLAQDDDRGGGHTSQVSFAATAGTTYHIAVGSGTSGRGAIVLNWQLSPALAIATPPMSQTVAVGGSASFSVQATGTGVSYQWMRNGVPIPGATSATLTVDNIQGGTDASYTVTVTNSTGSVTSAPAALSVAAPMLTDFKTRNVRTDGGLLWGVAAGSGTLVAVGNSGEILSSADGGITWTPRNSGTSLWLVGVTYGAGQFVVVGEAGTILTSTDAVTWTPAPSPGTTERINNVIYADGKFVAVGEHGIILTSADARTWTPRTSRITTWLHGLAYNAKIGYFATDGENGVVLISPDAITWTPLVVDGLTSHLEAMIAGDSYAEFVALGHEGMCVSLHLSQLRLKTGETVTTWTTELNPTGSTETFRGLASAAGALFAMGENGKIISAKDSRGPWYTIPSPSSELLLGATFANDTLYVVGARDTVLQSDPLYASRLVNISTRGQVGTGGNVMISGFVVTGSTPKQVVIRAAGPTLAAAPFNLPGMLMNPVLTVLDRNGKPLATNTRWSKNSNADALAAAMSKVGAFPFSRDSADSALLLTLDPGQYTAQVAGANGTTGLALVEVYDADAIGSAGSRAINISTRGVTAGGNDVMIAGFVVNGAASRRVLIRAVGPGLVGYGVTGAAAQPQLSLYNSRGLLTASAAAWGLQGNADEIRAAAKAVGAFDLADGSDDSAMLVTLLPGAWTVQVATGDGAPGVVLVEAYEVP